MRPAHGSSAELRWWNGSTGRSVSSRRVAESVRRTRTTRPRGPRSKTWLITGTSSGLGRRLTERLLERGDRVAATLRDPSALDGLRAVHGDRLWVARLDAYDATSAGDTRRAIAGGAFPIPGDAAKVVDAMIASADAPEAPLRLALGPDTFEDVGRDLRARLDALEAQRDLAFSVAVD